MPGRREPEDTGVVVAGSRRTLALRALLWVLVAGTGPALALLAFTSGGHDDSHITAWAADRLVQTGEIVNYNGDRVEQSSSLLHVLVTAALVRLTSISAPSGVFLAGLLGGSLTCCLAYVVGRHLSRTTGLLAVATVSLLPFLGYWSVGGLETTLASATLLAAVYSAARYVEGAQTEGLGTPRLLAVAVSVPTFVLVRPEAAAVFALAIVGFGAGWLVLDRAGRTPRTSRRILVGSLGILLLVDVLAIGLVTAWRSVYFGQAMPNPVLAKAQGLEIARGIIYLAKTLDGPDVVALVLTSGLAIVVLSRRPTVTTTLLAAAALAQLTFVVAVGGDWMGGGRFVVPALPPLAILSAHAIVGLPRQATVRRLAFGLVAVQVVGLVRFAHDESLGKPLWSQPTWAEADGAPARDVAQFAWSERNGRVHLRDTVMVEPLVEVVDQLAPHVDGPVTLASGQAGMLAFHLAQRRYEQIRFVDVHNLVTRGFRRCSSVLRSSSFGLTMPYGYWFDHPEQCGVPIPDIVFDINDFGARAELHDDFALLRQTDGSIGTGSSLLPGGFLSGAQYIAVRRDLIEHVTIDV